MNDERAGVEVLKTLWTRPVSGKWEISALKALSLTPSDGYGSDYFALSNRVELLTNSPRGLSAADLSGSFGSTSFLLKQSIVPVVALVDGETEVRVIGTAFFISASGLLMTACHVLLDPEDRGYGDVTNDGGVVRFGQGLQMGVLIPLNPAFGKGRFQFAPFHASKFWGAWKSSPLLHQRDRVEMDTDVAICRIAPLPGVSGYQPLNLSLHPFFGTEHVFAIGYAEMDDIPFKRSDGMLLLEEFSQELFVSAGETTAVHSDNMITKAVPTPGPCFEFMAKIPGKMSGGPILGAEGAVVRGLVSRSFSGEMHAFGALLGPATHLPLFDHRSIRDLMLAGTEGIPQIRGPGL